MKKYIISKKPSGKESSLLLLGFFFLFSVNLNSESIENKVLENLNPKNAVVKVERQSSEINHIIPVVANTPGAQESYWITDVSISNPAQENLNINMKFYKTGVSENPIETQITLNSNETITLENPLQTMGVQNSSGTLEIESNKKLVITARTFNLQQTQELGQGMKGFFDLEYLKKGEKVSFCNVKNINDYRFNFGLFSKEQTKIKFDIFSNGNNVHSIVKDFLPNLHIQQEASSFFGTQIPENAAIIAEVLDGIAYIYASSIKNNTGDGSFEEMNKIGSAVRIPMNEDRVYFSDEYFNGKNTRQIIKENREAIAEIFAKGYYYDTTIDPEKTKPLRPTKEEWSNYLLQLADGGEKFRQFNELYVFNNMVFGNNGINWIVFSDAYARKYWEGWDLEIEGLTQEDINNFNRIILTAMNPDSDKELLIPIVANTPGAYDSYWKSDLWLFNPEEKEISGKILFKPSGVSTQDLDGIDFILAPKQVKQYTNFLESLGLQGFGAAKIKMENGTVPKVKLSTYNEKDGKELMQGMNGIALAELLTKGEVAYLINVKDISKYRFNIGVYAEKESNIKFSVYAEDGTFLYENTKYFPEKYHIQQDANTFLGYTLPRNARVKAEVLAGQAKIYGSGVQNESGDGYYQDAIVLSRYLYDPNSLEDKTKNYVFPHNKKFGNKYFYQIMYDNARAFAEILGRENIYLSNTKDNATTHFDADLWEKILKFYYDNDISKLFEAEHLLLDTKKPRIIFTDIYMGADLGEDTYTVGMTDKDMEDIIKLLEQFINNSYSLKEE